MTICIGVIKIPQTIRYHCFTQIFASFLQLDAEIVWCQEEPMNMGAYYYVLPRLWTCMKSLDRGNMEDIKYVGRAPSAATATGFYKIHMKEQSELVLKAMQSQPINYPF